MTSRSDCEPLPKPTLSPFALARPGTFLRVGFFPQRSSCGAGRTVFARGASGEEHKTSASAVSHSTTCPARKGQFICIHFPAFALADSGSVFLSPVNRIVSDAAAGCRREVTVPQHCSCFNETVRSQPRQLALPRANADEVTPPHTSTPPTLLSPPRLHAMRAHLIHTAALRQRSSCASTRPISCAMPSCSAGKNDTLASTYTK